MMTVIIRISEIRKAGFAYVTANDPAPSQFNSH
jgi:hypothetical protein